MPDINCWFLLSASLLLTTFFNYCNQLATINDNSVGDNNEARQGCEAWCGNSYWLNIRGRQPRVSKVSVSSTKRWESSDKAVYECATDKEAVVSSVENSKWQSPRFDNKTEMGNRSKLAWPFKIPKRIDYRDTGHISSVDHQKLCASCWAFAVVGTIEGLMQKTTGRMEKLSSQQVIDCTGCDSDCDGGSGPHAMCYARLFGLQTACNYPYEDSKKECRFNPRGVVFKFKRFVIKYNLSEKKLKAYVATVGPIATRIIVTQSFIDYKGGIFSTDECKLEERTNHLILIVGYGHEDGGDNRKYWLLKNTHGIGWGERGFMRFQRNIGLCMIGDGSLWPTV